LKWEPEGTIEEFLGGKEQVSLGGFARGILCFKHPTREGRIGGLMKWALKGKVWSSKPTTFRHATSSLKRRMWGEREKKGNSGAFPGMIVTLEGTSFRDVRKIKPEGGRGYYLGMSQEKKKK